jgi:hypothetical protein
VPVLARLFEAGGIATVLVTNMPFWAERIGAPRTLAAEFPFGHALGPANDREMQRRVILRALDLLERATAPGEIEDFEEPWAGSVAEGRRASEPKIPAPITAQMGRHIGRFLRGLQRSG